MSGLEALQSVQYVTVNGKRFAVVSAEDWEAMLEWLEDVEDNQIIRSAAERLRRGPEESDAVPIEKALDELQGLD